MGRAVHAAPDDDVVPPRLHLLDRQVQALAHVVADTARGSRDPDSVAGPEGRWVANRHVRDPRE
jgi:hypothetical protein